jgi:O-6-methylguanine DNA methyltransferase
MTDPLVAALGPVPAPPTLEPRSLEAVGLADRYVVRPSPIGSVLVAYNGEGVSACIALGDPAPDDVAGAEARFAARFDRPLRPDPDPDPALVDRIDRALAGERVTGLRFDLRSVGVFGRAVLAKAAEIPAGEVRPYGWIAAEIGRPKAVRAVGTALGRNPVPLLIPCHRVVRTDGRIGDYAFGSPAKRAVLAAEGVDLALLAR